MNPIQMIQQARKSEEDTFYEPMKKRKEAEEKLRLMKETREYGIEKYKAERKQIEYGIEKYKAERKQIEEGRKTREAFKEEKSKLMKLRAEPLTSFLGKVREGIRQRKIKEVKGKKQKLGKGIEAKPSSIFSLSSGSPSSIFQLGSPKGVERESVKIEPKPFDFGLERPSLTGQRNKVKSYYRLGK